MIGINHINAFVILHFAGQGLFKRVIAVKHRIERRNLGPRLSQHHTQRHASPFADAAPTFHAIVPGDLGARGQGRQLGMAYAQRRLDKTGDRQPIVAKPAVAQCHIVGAVRVGRAIGALALPNIGFGEFRRKTVSRQQTLRPHRQPVDGIEHPAEAVVSLSGDVPGLPSDQPHRRRPQNQSTSTEHHRLLHPTDTTRSRSSGFHSAAPPQGSSPYAPRKSRPAPPS